MKLTYLGTGAAEGFPALYCNCEYCQEARRTGGKNIRTRSQSLINDDLLIDYPADTYSHFLNYGIEGDTIKYLFITHSHPDHLYPNDLCRRYGNYAHDMRIPVLQIYCAQGAFDKINDICKGKEGIQVHLIKPYEKIQIEGYEIIPLPAKHAPGDEAVIYIIKGDKTILYAHDTASIEEEVFQYIEQEKIVFDMISMDCTMVDNPHSGKNHMGIKDNEILVDRLREIGAVDDKTIKFINHFSHNGNPIYDVLKERVKDLGFHVSYDGLEVTI